MKIWRQNDMLKDFLEKALVCISLKYFLEKAPDSFLPDKYQNT